MLAVSNIIDNRLMAYSFARKLLRRLGRLFNDIASVPSFVQPQLPLESLYAEIDRMQKRTFPTTYITLMSMHNIVR